jgi:thiol-disulfide isomerase/thioredoxin
VLAVQIGPLAFPTGPLLWGLGCLAGQILASRWVRRRGGADAGRAAGDAFWRSVLVGFVAARLGFVLPGWADYAATPWLLLDIRDGGWAPGLGVLAAAATLAMHAARQRAWAAPLAAGGLLAVAVWAGGGSALGLHRQLPVPDIPLLAQDGTPARLPAQAQGRPTVVNLRATWCGPCRAELPTLAAARAARPDVAFLFVNQGEDAVTVRRFLQGQGLAIDDAVWLDRRRAAATAVDSDGLPTTLFFDAQGRLSHRHVGLVTEAALRVRLAALGDAPAAAAPAPP